MSKHTPLGLVVLVGILLSTTGCYFLQSEPVPAVSNYDLDLPGLRRLARSIPGPLPVEMRMVVVCEGNMPGAVIMAGASWEGRSMPRPVFQVRSPDGRFTLLDSAMSREAHEAMASDRDPWSQGAWDQVVRGLSEADRILITHEHADHIGGVAAHPDPMSLVGRLLLNEAQRTNAWTLDAGVSTELLDALEPMEDADAVAVAPGIVVKRAPGHTPGNQMVFVTLADGAEILFVGDVVWNRDALTELRYRPRFVTNWILDEDRQATIHQLRALRDLLDSDEGVHVLVAHDARTFDHPAIREGFVFAEAAP